MADPVFRASSNAAAQTGATFSVSKPTGTADGDLLVAFQATLLSGGTAPVVPSGWTILGTRQSYAAGANDLVCWYKVANGEGASWTFNGPAGGSLPTSSVYVAAFSGPPATTPEGSTKSSNTSTTADPTAYTTLLPNEILFVAWAIGVNTLDTITPHASFTALGSIGDSSCKMNVGYKTQAAAGASTNTTAALSNSLAWGAFLASVAPGAAAAAAAAFGGGSAGSSPPANPFAARTASRRTGSRR
jgi:hypothetical protein